MATSLKHKLNFLAAPSQQALLTKIQRGIEKEGLRAAADGHIAQTPHPRAFGSALCHPAITTDFSESLLEFITGVDTSIDGTLNELDAVHRFAHGKLNGELLWNASMPCILGGADDDIPLAQYGSSNTATMKTRYRYGLGHRYGRKMQTIAGIHYNFSLPTELWQQLHAEQGSSLPLNEFITDRYFALIRNFRRYAWLLIYLFGAAPALSSCFLNGRQHELEEFDNTTLYSPYATSLRMGDLGYQSNAQKDLDICYNQLDSYVNHLCKAITTSHPDYQKIPGDEQLSTGLLQIENEFYSPIRPKRVANSGEIPLGALRRGGVEYIEVRCLDINPLLPMGINAEQIRFVDAFLLFCLLDDSPPCDERDNAAITENISRTVNRGREPGLMLEHQGQQLSLQSWASELIDGVSQIANCMDQAHGGNDYQQSCAAQQAKVDDSALTPSAQILTAMRNNKQSYFEFAQDMSRQHAAEFKQRGLSTEEEAQFAEQRDASLSDQAAIEAVAGQPFEDYLAEFYAQYRAL
ncbi:MAG: glutamate--cysteine ligase [Spongiibacteraceae bacterium]